MNKSILIIVLSLLSNGALIAQTKTETYLLPDVCISDRISSPFTDIEINAKCFDSLGKITNNYSSISKCKGYMTYSTIEYMNDSNNIGQDYISEVLIYELEKINDNRWIKRDFKLNGEQVAEYFLAPKIPLEITRTDSIDYIDPETGKVWVGEVIEYIGFKWTK